MRIGVPKESYPLEKRIMVLPSSAKALVNAGHKVFVQTSAGADINISNKDYKDSGAKIITDSQELYSLADMVIKLKMPFPEEYSLMQNLILFCMVHSEQNPQNIYYAGQQNLKVVEMEKILDDKGERYIDETGMTGEAGVLYALQHSQKMPWDMKAVILGYGNVSSGAIEACSRLGIKYKIIRRDHFKNISKFLKETDLLINGITWPKYKRARKDYLVTREDIKNSKPGMIILDLSVDFPNPIETVRPTSYSRPFYIEEDRVHISIYGYPGLFPETSSRIYSEQVLPLAMLIANNKGLKKIERKGSLGEAISKAIMDTTNWEQYKPTQPSGSGIE